jgi:hypothetical protein
LLQRPTRLRWYCSIGKVEPKRRRRLHLQKVAMRTIEEVTDRVRAEYLEMPGLRLKAEQVQRLCGIEQRTCQVVLDTLLDAKFLCVKPGGHYARLTEGQLSQPPSATPDYVTDRYSKRAS